MARVLVYFCEAAVQYIHEQGEILENMGDYLTAVFEEMVQILNKEKTADKFEKYKDRMKAIIHTSAECREIHDALEYIYSDLKWKALDKEDSITDIPGVISYAAMSKWLKIPEDIRQQLMSNVWCAKCSGSTTIKDFTVQVDKYGIVLQGFCSKCGQQVARVIEN